MTRILIQSGFDRLVNGQRNLMEFADENPECRNETLENIAMFEGILKLIRPDYLELARRRTNDRHRPTS